MQDGTREDYLLLDESERAYATGLGGRVLDLSGAEYIIRGLGYLRSLDDLATVAVGSRNGTPVKGPSGNPLSICCFA